ncbi:MAG: efflux RND transporter periplasmic adaptor subunit [Candidatus Rokuibacteriota bacterium]|nr:MAG: efflux RND transporter periplasmic adaptor subunit [Candidatus Rokubacteria bacterium]
MRPALALSLLLAAGVSLTACSGDKAESKQSQQQRRPPVPVTVASVERKTVPLEVRAIGTVEAYSVVSVRAQVGGELLKIHINEGQDVHKGDLLFTIDPRQLEAALAQSQATMAKDQVQVQQARAVLERDRSRVSQTQAALARDQAQAKNAMVAERRYADLLKRELIAQEQYDQFRTNAESLTATVRADEADVKSAQDTVVADEAAVKSAEELVRADQAGVDNARVQLSYATIRSPIDGRTGSLLLHEGNVVRANDSTLLTINQVQPTYVSFTVPQQQLASIKRYMAGGRLEAEALGTGDERPVRGVVTFIDNAVDTTTGTIRLKATFANEERRLWPGQFVNVVLTLATEANALVVPSQAVQVGQQNISYVFVVKPDATVENRRITVARTQGNDTVVASGLQPGEKVVTDGQARLVPGAKVEIRGAGGNGERPGGGGERPGGGGERPPRGERSP